MSAITPPQITEPTGESASLAYTDTHEGRDLRLDFLRGLVMLVVVFVHQEYFSLFGMLVWERIGLVSSAEGFVTLSGVVLGIVYRKRLVREGFRNAAVKLWRRSFQLYWVNVAVILSIALFGLFPFIDNHVVTHWVAPGDHSISVLLYPEASAPWKEWLWQALLLKIGPHQFQVIGLYVLLIALAPFALYLMHKDKTVVFLALSWALYTFHQFNQIRLTGARFEFAFPLLSWQVLFFSGMAVGYHKHAISAYFSGRRGYALVWAAAILSGLFLILAANNPNRIFWPWQTFSFIDAESFRAFYVTWFQKSALGFGRILNNICLFIVFCFLLSRFWVPLNRMLGWLLIPLGQASLYVFITHVYFVLMAANTPLNDYNNFYVNTVVHGSTILLIWLMVKHQVLFRIIPR